KQRTTGTETHVVEVIGEVRDRPCLIVDDMITTGGTMATAIAALLQAGARPEIVLVATHGVMLAEAKTKLGHPALRDIFVTDSIERRDLKWPQLHPITVAPLLAAAIEHLATGKSVRPLE